ncbi:EndoU domain-containing protein [Aurantimicrobium sp. MWH-Uga1]|uniref:EndoU domain-containing protein n=1 Tax=Aurantimicrobium sp. MWH-Uga1 TaxID=2079575 RepID=UPI000DED4F68|nr:EndoU domain-containing protein [Aurantimicrobium sp. MWH-Uga1]AXE53960.1 hypothetical protein AURUGA1_00248 [Aurantimicrobium sp. MWH-Uga1]
MGCPHVEIGATPAVDALLNLARMVFESFAHVPVTEELLRHVWEGEDDINKGGHRFGLGRVRKTEFPEEWTQEDVQRALAETLKSPQVISGRKAPYFCDREVNGVVVRVVLKEGISGLQMHAAYPLCGQGVYRNDPGGKVALPLDLYIWEE